jgi:hypothetical protein
MNNTPSQLNTDLAALLGFAAGNRTKASEAINQAKQGLGIDKLTKSLTADDKAAIIQWHKARLTDKNQLDIETIAPAALQLINAPLSELELLRIENAKLQARLETIDHKAAPTYHFNETVRIAFYIGEKRQIIALSGFYLNALMLAAGIDKKGIAAWIKAAVSEWGAFDDKLNITEQVKRLIVRELESELIKARG